MLLNFTLVFCLLQFMSWISLLYVELEIFPRKRHTMDDEEDVPEWRLLFGLWCLNPAIAFWELNTKAHSIILTSGTLAPLDTFASEVKLISFGLAANCIDCKMHACFSPERQLQMRLLEGHNNIIGGTLLFRYSEMFKLAQMPAHRPVSRLPSLQQVGRPLLNCMQRQLLGSDRSQIPNSFHELIDNTVS